MKAAALGEMSPQKYHDAIMSKILFLYASLGTVCWTIWALVYQFLLGNTPAFYACISAAILCLFGLVFFKFKTKQHIGDLYFIVSCLISLVLGAFTLGGITSVSNYWLFVVTVAAYLLLKRKGGVLITICVCLCFIAMVSIQELTNIKAYYFDFSPTSSEYRIFVAINLMSCFCLFSVFIMLFDSQVRSAYDRVSEANREIRSKNLHIEAILNSISSGIFSINEKGIIQDECSDYLKNCLDEQSLAGSHYLDTIFRYARLNQDQVKSIDTILISAIGEDPIQFFANEESLPKEISFDLEGEERLFEFSFDTILLDGIVKEILINLKDVTEQRMIQKLSEKREEETLKIARLATLPPNRIRAFFIDASMMIEKIKESQDSKNKELLRVLHTIKGNARNLGLNDLAELAHLSEEIAIEVEAQVNDEKFSKALGALISAVNEYEELIQKHLGIKMNENRMHEDSEQYEKDTEMIERFYHKEGVEIPKPVQNLLDKIAISMSLSAKEILFDLGRDLPRIAKDLNKPQPKLEVSGEDFYLGEEDSSKIRTAVIHLLRNSMDHGIEDPSDRLSKGKREYGSIFIDLSLSDDSIVIQIYDDGRGLDLEKIKAKAEIKSMSADARDPSALANLIFEDDFSTRDEVSYISGRGIGMAAVKQSIEDLDGSIEIQLKDSAEYGIYPFYFDIQLPKRINRCNLLGAKVS